MEYNGQLVVFEDQPSLYYREGYKYQSSRPYAARTGIRIFNSAGWWRATYKDVTVDLPFVRLDPTLSFVGNHWFRLYLNGDLFIFPDYAWDGPSGPTIDTKTFMRGSYEHDMLYQAMRELLLPPTFRIIADMRLREICTQDRMCPPRVAWVYAGVRVGAAGAIKPRENEELKAP